MANSADEVRERVRALLNGGADFIKVIATGAVLTRGTRPGVPEFTEQEIRAAVEQAADYGTFVAAHAHGAEGIKRAVRAGVRSIEHGSLMDDEAIALMKQRGTWLVADIWNGDYIDSVGREQKWPEDVLRKTPTGSGAATPCRCAVDHQQFSVPSSFRARTAAGAPPLTESFVSFVPSW